jgi:hypothetical protein
VGAIDCVELLTRTPERPELGEVTRRPLSEVMYELEASEMAAEAAAHEARRALHKERKAEVSADFEERVGKMKEKLHVS